MDEIIRILEEAWKQNLLEAESGGHDFADVLIIGQTGMNAAESSIREMEVSPMPGMRDWIQQRGITSVLSTVMTGFGQI